MRPLRAALVAALLLVSLVSLAPSGSALPCKGGGSRVPSGFYDVCLLRYTFYAAASNCGHLSGYTYTVLAVGAGQHTGPLDAAASARVVQSRYDYVYLACWGGPASGSGKTTSADAAGAAEGFAASAGFDQKRDAARVGSSSASSKSTSVHAFAAVAAASVGQASSSRSDAASSTSSKDTGLRFAVGPTAPEVFVGQQVRDGDCELVAGGGLAQPCGPVPVAPDVPEVPDFPQPPL